MDFTPIDYILVIVMAGLGVWGLWRGIAGELAAVAWIATALLVGFFAYSPMCRTVDSVAAAGGGGGGARLAAVGITVFVALVAALLMRRQRYASL